MWTAVNPFAHFSLAPSGPIGDNPALSDSGGTRGRQFQKGREQGARESKTLQHAHESRSLKRETKGPAFHSLFTSVEMMGRDFILR